MSKISAQHYGKTNKRGYYKYNDLLDFRLWLIKNGANKSNMTYFLRGVTEFRKTGMDIDKGTLIMFREQLDNEGINYRYSSQMVKGVEYYRCYMNGEELPKKISKVFECDEDCFNCKYPDCYMPDYMISTKERDEV